AWENARARQWDYYQGLQLQVRPRANVAVRTNVRVARRGDPAEWQERLYNGYVDWQSSGRDVQVRLGRQYVYRGVVNGSVDGVLLRARPLPRLDLQLVGGVTVPFDRPLRVQGWDE